MLFLQGFIKFDQGISEKYVGQTFDGRKEERKKERKKERRIETEQTQYVSQTSLGGHNYPSWLSLGTSIKSDGVKLVYSRFFYGISLI